MGNLARHRGLCPYLYGQPVLRGFGPKSVFTGIVQWQVLVAKGEWAIWIASEVGQWEKASEHHLLVVSADVRVLCHGLMKVGILLGGCKLRSGPHLGSMRCS